jgi:GTPase SAR1 family protein
VATTPSLENGKSVPIIVAIWAVVALLGLGLTAIFVVLWLNRDGDVAVIGRQSAGKTTMLRFLADGRLPPSQAPTTFWKPLSIQIENKTFVAFDTAGDRLDQWIKALDSSNDVLYLFDASLIACADAEALSAIAADTDHIRDYVSRKGKKLHFTLVGTHSDLFQDAKQDEVTVREHAVIQELQLICHTARDGLIIGSLATEKSAKSLTKKVFHHAAKGS